MHCSFERVQNLGELALSQDVYSGGVMCTGKRQARVLRRRAEETFNYARDYLKDFTRGRELGLATGLEVIRAEQ